MPTAHKLFNNTTVILVWAATESGFLNCGRTVQDSKSHSIKHYQQVLYGLFNKTKVDSIAPSLHWNLGVGHPTKFMKVSARGWAISVSKIYQIKLHERWTKSYRRLPIPIFFRFFLLDFRYSLHIPRSWCCRPNVLRWQMAAAELAACKLLVRNTELFSLIAPCCYWTLLWECQHAGIRRETFVMRNANGRVTG
jgi:hypothetical protein